MNLDRAIEELGWRAARVGQPGLNDLDRDNALGEFHCAASPAVVLKLITRLRHHEETIEQVHEHARVSQAGKDISRLLRERRRDLERAETGA